MAISLQACVFQIYSSIFPIDGLVINVALKSFLLNPIDAQKLASMAASKEFSAYSYDNDFFELISVASDDVLVGLLPFLLSLNAEYDDKIYLIDRVSKIKLPQPAKFIINIELDRLTSLSLMTSGGDSRDFLKAYNAINLMRNRLAR